MILDVLGSSLAKQLSKIMMSSARSKAEIQGIRRFRLIYNHQTVQQFLDQSNHAFSIMIFKTIIIHNIKCKPNGNRK